MAYFTPCSSVSIVNFEHVIAGWNITQSKVLLQQYHNMIWNCHSKQSTVSKQTNCF